MNILGFNIERREATSSTPQQQTRSANIRGNVIQAGGEQTSLMVAAVYRAVALRADTMSQLVMQYQVRSKAGRNFTTADMFDDGRRMNYLLQVKPNRWTNWPTMMRQAEIRRVMRGNAYIYVHRDGYRMVDALYLCDSATFFPGEDVYNIIYTVGGGSYKVDSVPMEDIIHLRNTYSFDGGQTGVSTLRYAARALNVAATQDQLALDSASRGGKRSLIVSEQGQQTMGLGKVNKGEMEKIAGNLDEQWSDSMVHYLPNVAEIKDFSMSLQELELLSSRKFSTAEVSRFFGVPRNLLGDDTNSSYKTPEAATLEFLTRTIAPLIREWETEFNGKLLTERDFGTYRYHLCEIPLFRLDRAGQAAWNRSRIETGVASINELRAEQDMPNIGSVGDDYYVSTNLAVAGSDKLRYGSGAADQQNDGKEENDGNE